ncbi:MAG: exo-beta-N-acetylmuramidase NamZ domain-containing protein [Flavobacteriales bacterium]
MKRLAILFLTTLALILHTADAQPVVKAAGRTLTDADVVLGAEKVNDWLPLLRNKPVALVANHTSLIGKTHLVDTMLSLKLNVKKVFAPEHGFRGMADAGEKVSSSTDERTGLPIISLYGANKKPTQEQLQDVKAVVFDIQDVGARFYTYISTMAYVMDVCAMMNIDFIVFDRPNPNGHYVDGPLLKPAFKSFVGLHPVPIVHGMTVGEYARMVNEEGWLESGKKCKLTVITCDNYTHEDYYQISVPPSPNLTTMSSIYLYPSLCLFEGTPVSVGRGTDRPFTMIGMPNFPVGDFTFTPRSGPGSKKPMYENKECRGFDLQFFGDSFIRNSGSIYLYWLINFYSKAPDKEKFFNNFFDKLAGNDVLKQQIKNGLSEEEIRKTWKADIDKFKAIRKKYLLYKDFG